MDELERRGLCPFTFGRVNDRVYSSIHNGGYINRISYYPPLIGLIVCFDNSATEKYTLSGFREKASYTADDKRELYWNSQCAKYPLMPKWVADRNSVFVETTEFQTPIGNKIEINTISSDFVTGDNIPYTKSIKNGF